MGMCRFWFSGRREHENWVRHISVHVLGLVLCLTILSIMVVEKFGEGAWKTLVITCVLVVGCVWVRAHYRSVQGEVRRLDRDLLDLPAADRPGGEPDPSKPTAVLLVRDFGGVGIHLLLLVQKMFPGFFKNVIFVSVAVIDSGHFKGKEEMSALRDQVEESLAKYVELARRIGWNAASATTVTTDPVDGIYRVCVNLAKKYRRGMFFGGKRIWKREGRVQRLLALERPVPVAGGVPLGGREPFLGQEACGHGLHLEAQRDGRAAGERVGQETAGHLPLLHETVAPGLDLGADGGREQDRPAAAAQALVQRPAGRAQCSADEADVRLPRLRVEHAVDGPRPEEDAPRLHDFVDEARRPLRDLRRPAVAET